MIETTNISSVLPSDEVGRVHLLVHSNLFGCGRKPALGKGLPNNERNVTYGTWER